MQVQGQKLKKETVHYFYIVRLTEKKMFEFVGWNIFQQTNLIIIYNLCYLIDTPKHMYKLQIILTVTVYFISMFKNKSPRYKPQNIERRLTINQCIQFDHRPLNWLYIIDFGAFKSYFVINTVL